MRFLHSSMRLWPFVVAIAISNLGRCAMFIHERSDGAVCAHLLLADGCDDSWARQRCPETCAPNIRKLFWSRVGSQLKFYFSTIESRRVASSTQVWGSCREHDCFLPLADRDVRNGKLTFCEALVHIPGLACNKTAMSLSTSRELSDRSCSRHCPALWDPLVVDIQVPCLNHCEIETSFDMYVLNPARDAYFSSTVLVTRVCKAQDAMFFSSFHKGLVTACA